MLGTGSTNGCKGTLGINGEYSTVLSSLGKEKSKSQDRPFLDMPECKKRLAELARDLFNA